MCYQNGLLIVDNDEKFAAFLMYGIATKHPFFDGNKRTALMTFLIFRFKDSEIIKKHFPASWDTKDDKIVKFMVELASYKYSYEEVLKLVREIFI